MILEVSWDDLKFEVQLQGAKGKQTVRLGEKQMSCDWVRLPGGRYSVILDGRVFDLAIYSDGPSCTVQGRDGQFVFRVHDPSRAISDEETEDPETGMARLCADMPGKVIRVLVKKGEMVQYEQPLVVLEAMKMQNEIRSPKTGRILQVGVHEGKAVGNGDFLVSIE